MAIVLLIVAIILLVYLVFSFATGKPPNSPPGIIRLPIWGSYWLLLWGNYKFPHETLKYYVKKHKSKIIGGWLGDFYTIFVNDYKSVKEVLGRKEFDGRLGELDVAKARAFGKKLGIFFNDDYEWQEQRRFALHNMRNVGFGRRHRDLENDFNEEIQLMIDIIKNGPINEQEKAAVNGDLVHFPTILFPPAANSIWKVMAGERLPREEHEELRKVCLSACLFQVSGDTSGGAIGITWWLKYFGNLFGYSGFVAGTQGIANFVKKFIDKMDEENLMDNSQNIGFIKTYLRTLKQRKDNNIEENDEMFSEEQLIMVVVDFMFPALSAVPAVVGHCIKYMMHYPEVMKRVQEEIDHVVGRERLPGWDDRQHLVYTEATIREVLRSETLTPLSVAHRCTQTTTLDNFTIPKETVVVTNLAGMHTDPDFWGDPEEFRPERFLTEDQTKLAKDCSFPFGFGRRLCAGETFGRFAIFAMFSGLLQNFTFEMVKGQPSGFNDKLSGIIVQPKSAWVRVKAR